MKRILLAVNIAILAIFVLASPKLLIASQEHREEFNQTYDLSRQGTFEINNINGLVVVTTWPEEKVGIRAVKKTRRDPKNLQLVKVEVEATADRVAVKTVYPRLRNTGVTVDYELRLPEKLAFTAIKVVNGQVKVAGPLNQLKASTVNGNIQASGIEGPANLETTNGQIEVSLSSGPSRMETVNGNVECRVVSLKENLSIETVNGSVEMKIAAEVQLNGYLDARTTNGTINVDVPVLFQNLRRTRGSLEGQIGSGGPLIRLRTVNGGIRISK